MKILSSAAIVAVALLTGCVSSQDRQRALENHADVATMEKLFSGGCGIVTKRGNVRRGGLETIDKGVDVLSLAYGYNGWVMSNIVTRYRPGHEVTGIIVANFETNRVYCTDGRSKANFERMDPQPAAYTFVPQQ